MDEKEFSEGQVVRFGKHAIGLYRGLNEHGLAIVELLNEENEVQAMVPVEELE
jgi:hypothetical protein